jgi:hypothetical protein
MKKQLPALACFLMIATVSFPQIQKFDIASFVPPQGWQRVDTAGTVAYFHSATANGLTSFCQIILYPSSRSAGNVEKDFKAAWSNLVSIPTKSTARPIIEKSKTADGWNVMTGASKINVQGFSYNTMVTTITGFGKTISVQSNLAGNDYTDVIQKFFETLELDSRAAPATDNRQGQSPNNAVNINDFDFITPEGWLLQNKQDHLLLQNPQSGCTIRILSQPSSGDLEKDANTIFDVMYAGWQYQKTGAYQYVLSKGFLPKGLEYFMKEASMSVTGSDGRYLIEEGAALVVRSGTQIVIIGVRHNSGLMAHDGCRLNYNTWKRFFNSFTVKNAVVPDVEENNPARIVGAWTQTESGATSDYVFAANGHYAMIGTIGSKTTSSDYRYEYLHIKTYAFEGDGTYEVSGNRLALKQKTGGMEELQFRLEQINNDSTGWKDRLCMRRKDAKGEYEVRYERKEN